MANLTPPELSKTLSTASLSASSSIIYEINLSVPIANSSSYTEWLRSFTKQVCADNKGFIGCQVFSQPKPVGLYWLSEENEQKSYFTVHYHIETQEDLDTYLAIAQEKVSQAEQDKFQYLVTSRRILRLISNTLE